MCILSTLSWENATPACENMHTIKRQIGKVSFKYPAPILLPQSSDVNTLAAETRYLVGRTLLSWQPKQIARVCQKQLFLDGIFEIHPIEAYKRLG